MSHAFRMHGMNKCEVIHLTGYVGKKRGDGLPTFAVLLEIPQGFHQFPLALFAEGCGADTYEINVLAVLGDQFGLVVESIDVTGSARHEDEDYALSSLRDEGGLGGQGIARESLGALHAGHGQRTETACRALEHLAPGKRLGYVLHGFLFYSVQVAKVEAGKKSMKDAAPSILLVCASTLLL